MTWTVVVAAGVREEEEEEEVQEEEEVEEEEEEMKICLTRHRLCRPCLISLRRCPPRL